MQVLGRVLDHPQPLVTVLHRVDGHGLEATPAVGDDERVVRFEDATMPAMLLDSDLAERLYAAPTRICPSISSLSSRPPTITGISGRARRVKAGETSRRTMRQ